MNLDIMSLMAASAAVAETSAKGTNESGLPGDGAVRGEGEASFTDVLQTVIENSSTAAEIRSAPVAGPEESLAEQITTVIDGRMTPVLPENDTRNPQVDPATTGGNLPPTGKDLPPAALPDDRLTPLQALPETELTTMSAAPAAPLTPAAGATDLATARPAVTGEPVTTVKPDTSKTVTTGWFSQAGADAPDEQASLMRAAANPAGPSGASSAAQGQPSSMPSPLGEAERSMATAAPTLSAARSALQLAAKEEGRPPVALSGAAPPQTETLAGLETPRGVAAPNAVTAPSVPQPAAPIPGTTPVLNMAQAGWDQALGQRLVFMARNGLEKAELRLDPPHLGSINVKLAIQGEQAQLIMQAANPAAREVLEGALPRLREMLGAEGLQLGSAEVADRDTSGRERSASSDDGQWTAEHAETVETDSAEQVVSVDHLTLPQGRIYEKV